MTRLLKKIVTQADRETTTVRARFRAFLRESTAAFAKRGVGV
jgi:hypothetical protein